MESTIEDLLSESQHPSPEQMEPLLPTPQPQKRPRGRPRKTPKVTESQPQAVVESSNEKSSPNNAALDSQAQTSACTGTSNRKGQLHRMYSIHQKQKVAEYAHVHGIRPASRQFGVSRKNIQRWVAEGLHEVKNKGNFKKKNAKGQGRKVSYPAEIETKLVQWLLEKQNLEVKVSNKMLKQEAIALITPTNPNFKASDGWSQKFMRRNNLVLKKKLQSHESQKCPVGTYFQYENL